MPVKSRIAHVALAAVWLTACAAAARPPQAPPAGGEEIVGWINFRGEFLLYPRQEDIGRTLDESCTSGTFARIADFKAAARRFEGKRVRLTGRLLPADSYFNDSGLGQRIENYCGSRQVLIATGISAAPLPR
jgi:hypothetical protein